MNQMVLNVIIKEKETNLDGGPGSGRYPKGSKKNSSVDYKAAKEYTKELKGTVASNGVTVKAVSGHAAYRMKTKGYDAEYVKEVMTNPSSTYPGNSKHKNATCFQKGDARIVMSDSGVIITTINLEVQK